MLRKIGGAMADQSESQPGSRHNAHRSSHLRSLSYTQYHDPEQDLFWPEPLDHLDAQPEPEIERSPPEPPRKDVIKRRPVAPVILTSRLSPIDTDLKPTLSPIIPSPLRIRRPKTPSPQPPMRSVRLLIASLGNPPPYHSTRHSAGHIVLKHLARHLDLPALTKS